MESNCASCGRELPPTHDLNKYGRFCLDCISRISKSTKKIVPDFGYKEIVKKAHNNEVKWRNKGYM